MIYLLEHIPKKEFMKIDSSRKKYRTMHLLLRIQCRPALFAQVNDHQKSAYTSIMKSVQNGSPAFFFVSGYGSTGKTFLWKAITTTLRAEKNCSNCCIFRSCITPFTGRKDCTFTLQDTSTAQRRAIFVT